MKNLRKILGWVLYLSIMCATISGLIIVLWEYPETSYLVVLFKISFIALTLSIMTFMGALIDEDLK